MEPIEKYYLPLVASPEIPFMWRNHFLRALTLTHLTFVMTIDPRDRWLKFTFVSLHLLPLLSVDLNDLTVLIPSAYAIDLIDGFRLNPVLLPFSVYERTLIYNS